MATRSVSWKNNLKCYPYAGNRPELYKSFSDHSLTVTGININDRDPNMLDIDSTEGLSSRRRAFALTLIGQYRTARMAPLRDAVSFTTSSWRAVRNNLSD